MRSPVLGHRDLDLYKLFKIVSQMNGMDKVGYILIVTCGDADGTVIVPRVSRKCD